MLLEEIDGKPVRNVVAGDSGILTGRFKNLSNETVAITDPMQLMRKGNVLGGLYAPRATTRSGSATRSRPRSSGC